MKIVYICSPLKGDIYGNIERAKKYTKFALLCGVAPVTSHFFALCINDDNPAERQLGMEAGKSLLEMCDEIWVFDKNKSEGMLMEIDYARRRLRIPVINIDSKYVDEILNKEGGEENE